MPSRIRVSGILPVALLLLPLVGGGSRAAEPTPLPAYRLQIETQPLRALQDYRDRIHDIDFFGTAEAPTLLAPLATTEVFSTQSYRALRQSLSHASE